MDSYTRNFKIERDVLQDAEDMKKVDAFLFWGLLITLLLVPLAARLHITEFTNPVLFEENTLRSGVQTDIFTYYKHIILLTSVIVLTVAFLYKTIFLHYKLALSKLNISVFAFYIAITLSILFAPYQKLALSGAPNRNDGSITYFCYLTIFFIAMNIQYNDKMLKKITYVFYPYIILNAVLGLLNFYGYDVLKISWVKNMIFSGLPEGGQISAGSKLVATLNHGNYVSGMSAMIFSLFFVWALYDRNKWRSPLNLVISLLIFATLLTALSSGGFMALLIVLVMIVGLLIFKCETRKVSWIKYGSTLVAMMIIYVGMVSHNSAVWDQTFGLFVRNNPFVTAETSSSQIISVEKKLFSPAKVYAEKSSTTVDTLEVTLPEIPESGVGPGSGRLYIWDKTLGLVKERPLFGYGLDTLTYYFPQDDPMKHANIQTYQVVVDKTHSMYVGTLYGTGIVGFLAFMSILIFGAIRAITFIIKNTFKSETNIITLALFSAIVAYLIQALFNDSLLGMTNVFFVLFGCFVSVIKVREEATEAK